nr:transposase domain-containing protein [Sphingobium lactosutens]
MGIRRKFATQAWLADVLVRIADVPQNQLYGLLPWNWRTAEDQREVA